MFSNNSQDLLQWLYKCCDLSLHLFIWERPLITIEIIWGWYGTWGDRKYYTIYIMLLVFILYTLHCITYYILCNMYYICITYVLYIIYVYNILHLYTYYVMYIHVLCMYIIYYYICITYYIIYIALYAFTSNCSRFVIIVTENFFM